MKARYYVGTAIQVSLSDRHDLINVPKREGIAARRSMARSYLPSRLFKVRKRDVPHVIRLSCNIIRIIQHLGQLWP